MKGFILRSIVVSSMLVMVPGCGGGSGDSNNDDNPDPIEEDHNEEQQTDNLNYGLKGRLFISEEESYLDLSSGRYTRIGTPLRHLSISPSADGSEFVEVAKNYRMVLGTGCNGGWNDMDRIAIRGTHTNLIESAFLVSQDVWGSAKLSPDGQAIAFLWQDEEFCPTGHVDTQLAVFSRDGEFLGRTADEAGDFAWLPDNRLLYALSNGGVYISDEPHGIAGTRIHALEGIRGFPARFKISPDGQKVVFEMVTGTPGVFEFSTYRDATVWMMNIDGSDLHLFAGSNKPDDPSTDSDDPQLNNPIWTLDGTKVLVGEGYFDTITEDYVVEPVPGYIIVPWEFPGLTYILSADEREAGLPPDGTLLTSVLVETDDWGNIEPVIIKPDSELDIVAGFDLPAEDAGSLPGENGAINRGIGGTIYSIGNSEGGAILQAIDVATGGITDVVTFSDTSDDKYSIDFTMSKDGQYFANTKRFDDDDVTLRVFHKDGEQLQRYVMITDSYEFHDLGEAQFSPLDPHLLAFAYKDPEHDSYITIFDWEQGSFRTITDREYNDLTWTAEGELMLWDLEGNAYRLTLQGWETREALIPEHLFKTYPGTDHSISPDGSKILFLSGGHVWTINRDGGGLSQITAMSASSYFDRLPEWSPDGRYILLKNNDNDNGSALWIVAADAHNIRIGESSPGTFPLQNSSGEHAGSYGPMVWVE
ncbi:MAG: hypothetical protein P8163_17155 [Candidatus Thiodiazotropha sp.]